MVPLSECLTRHLSERSLPTMTKWRIAMPKIHDVLRLHASELSARSIAQSLSISRGSVSNILSRAESAGVTWPLPEDCDEDKLESLLYPKAPGRRNKMVEPDWNYIFNESKKKEVTLLLLWTEFKRKEPNAYQYSQFCERYRQWRKVKQLSLRQIHRAGEKLFIDYA